jgi:hypothetical protein
MDETRDHHFQRDKPNLDKYHVFTHMWNVDLNNDGGGDDDEMTGL